MSDEKKCSAAWLCEPKYRGYVVLDPDGWDRLNFKESWAEEITEREFESRLLVSTVLLDHVGSPKVQT
jgi:hypothetical protein